jgi:hypothetical protein
MSVQRLPSGRWRAQVYDAESGKNLSVSKVLGAPGTYRTKTEAKNARSRARERLVKRHGVTLSEPVTLDEASVKAIAQCVVELQGRAPGLVDAKTLAAAFGVIVDAVTANRRCAGCSKPLPFWLRADARYCPGGRCKQAAHRKRHAKLVSA